MGRRPILILIIVLGILILAVVVVVFILNSGDVTLEPVTPAADVAEDRRDGECGGFQSATTSRLCLSGDDG